jgi:hypothetical protein
MIKDKIYRKEKLELIVDIMSKRYKKQLFLDNLDCWLYRDRVKISLFESIIYHEGEEQDIKDMTVDEMLSIKNKLMEKFS